MVRPSGILKLFLNSLSLRPRMGRSQVTQRALAPAASTRQLVRTRLSHERTEDREWKKAGVSAGYRTPTHLRLCGW
jgi:hypothetical protein